jgi:hypothetical protein
LVTQQENNCIKSGESTQSICRVENTAFFLKEIKIRKPPKGHNTPLEASYRHLLESPLHVLFLFGKSLKNRNGLKNIIKVGLGRLTT